jgi:flavin prenyltransferase
VLQGLLSAGHEVDCILTEAARKVLEVEESVRLSGAPEADLPTLRAWVSAAANVRLRLRDERDVGASVASGSYPVAGMVVVPCSTGTLGRIANGISGNLLERAADACLKERRRLVLVPRETPLSLVHLRNMVAVTEAGAIVLPAMPGFYHRPQSVQDMVDFVAARALSLLGVEAPFMKVWKGAPGLAARGTAEQD